MRNDSRFGKSHWTIIATEQKWPRSEGKWSRSSLSKSSLVYHLSSPPRTACISTRHRLTSNEFINISPRIMISWNTILFRTPENSRLRGKLQNHSLFFWVDQVGARFSNLKKWLTLFNCSRLILNNGWKTFCSWLILKKSMFFFVVTSDKL